MKHNWEYKRIGEICNILNGFAFKSDKYVDHGIRIMRITNVQKGYIIDDDPKYYARLGQVRVWRGTQVVRSDYRRHRDL